MPRGSYEEPVRAPVHECPRCGARDTLKHVEGTGDIQQVECSRLNVDALNPDRSGCGETFDVDTSDQDPEAELEAEVAELRAELRTLREGHGSTEGE